MTENEPIIYQKKIKIKLVLHENIYYNVFIMSVSGLFYRFTS